MCRSWRHLRVLWCEGSRHCQHIVRSETRASISMPTLDSLGPGLYSGTILVKNITPIYDTLFVHWVKATALGDLPSYYLHLSSGLNVAAPCIRFACLGVRGMFERFIFYLHYLCRFPLPALPFVLRVLSQSSTFRRGVRSCSCKPNVSSRGNLRYTTCLLYTSPSPRD